MLGGIEPPESTFAEAGLDIVPGRPGGATHAALVEAEKQIGTWGSERKGAAADRIGGGGDEPMQPVQFVAVVNQEQVIRPPEGLALPQGRVEVTVRPARDDEDLNWEDLDYASVPPKATKQVLVSIERRGNLQPMRHALDEE